MDKLNMDFLVEGLAEINIIVSDHQIKQFSDYYKLLIEWNKVMDLTTITDFKEVMSKHFIDSANLSQVIEIKDQKIIDVGTGAGFPGIPLKILFPDIEIVLLDSLQKRVVFLQEVVDELGLEKIDLIHGRAEDFGRNIDYRERFDICLSRAVAKLPILLEYCIPFVKEKGSFVCYKSGNVFEEIDMAKNALETLSSKIIKTEKYEVPGVEEDRYLLVVEKSQATDKKYPRNAGKPKKYPL